jgi:hypothetical protein
VWFVTEAGGTSARASDVGFPRHSALPPNNFQRWTAEWVELRERPAAAVASVNYGWFGAARPSTGPPAAGITARSVPGAPHVRRPTLATAPDDRRWSRIARPSAWSSASMERPWAAPTGAMAGRSPSFRTTARHQIFSP